MITINRANARAVYTTTNLKEQSLRSHEELSGDGSSGRSSYEAKRRAFKRAEDLIYLYSDYFMCFVTLTYKNQHSDYHKIINDIKNYFSRNGIVYIAVVEKHKSGNYHIHAITSELPDVYKSDFRDKRGNPQYKWEPWEKNLGITDVKFISGTDENFKIHKYIFKYMNKSEKIGGRYFLKSRVLKMFHCNLSKGGIAVELIHKKPLDFSTQKIYTVDNKTLIVRKDYYGNNSY